MKLRIMGFFGLLVAVVGLGTKASAEIKPINTVTNELCGTVREAKPVPGGPTFTQVCFSTIESGLGRPPTGGSGNSVIVLKQTRSHLPHVVPTTTFDTVWKIASSTSRSTRRGEVSVLSIDQIGSVSEQGFFEPKLTADVQVGELVLTYKGQVPQSGRGEVFGRKFKVGKFVYYAHTL